MSATFDVAVIGAGITGFAAALAAQQRGARVCVIRCSPGVTAVASGAWSGPLRAELRAALAAAGYRLEPVSAPLAHERGHTVACDFAAAAHTRATPNGGVVVCEIFGLPHFNARALARTWQPQRTVVTRTLQLRATPAAGWTALSLAAHIERDPATIIGLLPEAELLLLPAVMGVEQHALVFGAAEHAGKPYAEALAAAPSIPGWRLSRALESALAAHDIPCFAGHAYADAIRRKEVLTIRAGAEEISARAFVLATGKFTGGGITGSSEFRETVFDLPVWLEQLGDVFTVADALPLTDPIRTETQPLLSVGVHVDAQLRPVNRAGDVVFQNVFVAGTVRSDWHAAHAGLGHCAEDGWTAGINATT